MLFRSGKPFSILSDLVIIGGFVFWFGCFFFLFNYFKNILIIFFLFFTLITLFYFSLFLPFFLPLILSRVDERLLVLQPDIRAVPLRWESQVQDIGIPETSQLHVILNGDNLRDISISTPRASSTQRPESYSAGHPMQNNKQDRKTNPPTHREAA